LALWVEEAMGREPWLLSSLPRGGSTAGRTVSCRWPAQIWEFGAKAGRILRHAEVRP